MMLLDVALGNCRREWSIFLVWNKKPSVKSSMPIQTAPPDPGYMRRKSQFLPTWFRKRTDQHNHAKKIPGVGVRPALTKEQQKEAANNGGSYKIHVFGNKGHVSWKQFYRPLTNQQFASHASGTETYYFTGTGDPNADETMFGIDIDCHGAGTLAGAIAFAELLKTYFPGLYFELSTNGNGCHCYVVLKKYGYSARPVNAALKQFDKWLKQLADRVGADISGVEVKGHCHELQWADRDVEYIKFGQWIKYPRGDARNTTVIHIYDLARFQAESEQADPKPQRQKADNPSSKPRSGSWMPHAIMPFDLAEIPRLKALASKLGVPAQCSSGLVITEEDVAIFLLLLRFFTNQMNYDGTLPTARFEALWTALYDCGDVMRAFNAKRYAAIRNHLSALTVDGAALLTWEDESYCLGRMQMARISRAVNPYKSTGYGTFHKGVLVFSLFFGSKPKLSPSTLVQQVKEAHSPSDRVNQTSPRRRACYA